MTYIYIFFYVFRCTMTKTYQEVTGIHKSNDVWIENVFFDRVKYAIQNQNYCFMLMFHSQEGGGKKHACMIVFRVGEPTREVGYGMLPCFGKVWR